MSDFAITDQQITELPQADTKLQGEVEVELRKKARFSKFKEFQELKEWMEERIAYYQKYLPGGQAIGTVNQEDASKNWPIASIVIAELQQVIDLYANAEEAIKEINKQLK